MSDAWLDPGAHAVRFYETDAATYDSIADFLSVGASAGDPLVLVARPSTFDAVTRLLASGRYGPPVAADRIHFANASDALSTFMNGDRVDPARGAAFLARVLADVRSLHAGTIYLYGEMVDVLCERGNFAAAIALEGLFGGVFAFEPRLAVLCGYLRARFDGVSAAHKSAVCGLHTHVANETAGSPPHAADTPALAVYVVDDDPSIRRSLKRLLSISYGSVCVFESGEAFFADIDGLAPGVLVADIQLGGMSGLDILAHMKATRPTWPAIAMSGSDDPAAEREALRLGARVFLKKPFESDALIDAVAAVLA